MSFVILTGASGSGKTTIATAVEQRHGDEVQVFHFDRIGVPPVDRRPASRLTGRSWWTATMQQGRGACASRDASPSSLTRR